MPANVEQMLASGATSFYKKRRPTVVLRLREPASMFHSPIARRDSQKSIKDRTGVIKKNAGASLIDIGDGVACLEFHSKMNAIGGDTLQMLKFALGEVEKNFVGLVSAIRANFCVGANIMLMLMEAQEENWDELDMMARVFQNATMSLRYSPKPVVVAPFQMVFGGGCEMVLHADRVERQLRLTSDSSKSASELFRRAAARKRCCCA